VILGQSGLLGQLVCAARLRAAHVESYSDRDRAATFAACNADASRRPSENNLPCQVQRKGCVMLNA